MSIRLALSHSQAPPRVMLWAEPTPMHITPDPPSMTIARVRELAREMSSAPTPVVCSFTYEQLTDLLAEIDRRTQVAAAPVAAPQQPTSPLTAYAEHRKTCERCKRDADGRCSAGQSLYAAAAAELMDDMRILL